MNHTGRDFRKVGDAEQDRVPYMSVQEMALVHQAQAGYHGSYADAPAYVAPPPYADWQSSEVMSSIQVPFSDEVLSSAASTVSSGCLSGSSRGRRSRQRRKKAGDDSSSSSVPVFVPGTNRLLSNGSKNHHQGMCRPCYLNTSTTKLSSWRAKPTASERKWRGTLQQSRSLFTTRGKRCRMTPMSRAALKHQ
eukprot:TRINITY_DN35861_c0_g1_i1.p1 TRINITY_DN35861_c0_g1~~TRINITY_DN35861_c0_g1_i1.p1  ORF type:complete len:192 (+),score=15.19 TRINITY_DN35861_c0_g1_i1:89-664(+)